MEVWQVILVITLFDIGATACVVAAIIKNRVYKIRKGNHYSFHLPSPYFGLKKNFVLKVLFNESCKYNLVDVDQFDLNKLWGVSFGNHLKNSIRIGWRYNIKSDKIELGAYIHENGIIGCRWIGELETGIKYDIDFDLTKVGFGVAISYTPAHFEYKEFDFNYPKTKIGYYLFPYFGGNKTAPHDIKIKLHVS